MDNKFLIIDGSSLFFRAFYALPLLKTKRGLYTNAIYGFVMMVENAIEKVKPTHLAVCFDMKGKTFRSEIYKDYKGTRQKTPNELEQQWPHLANFVIKIPKNSGKTIPTASSFFTSPVLDKLSIAYTVISPKTAAPSISIGDSMSLVIKYARTIPKRTE